MGVAKVDPSLTLIRTQYPAIVGNQEQGVFRQPLRDLAYRSLFGQGREPPTQPRWQPGRQSSALHTIFIFRMGQDRRTRAYMARRTAEDKSKREIMRCLKRYVAREVYTVS